MKCLAIALIGAAMAQDSFAAAGTVPAGLAFPDVSGLVHPISHISKGGSTVCVSGTIKVEATTDENLDFKYEIPVNQSQVTQTFVSLWSPGVDFAESIMNGTRHVNGSYTIGATLCVPANGQTNKVQILTHGIGFDRRYWDFAPGYSYVDVAAAAGYAVFFYDRLGVGGSSKEDPLTTIQSPLELEILAALVDKLRRGVFSNRAFSTVVGVGHSFGSALTQGLTASYPKALDAAVLTGFSVNASGMPAFSLGQNPTIASADQPYRFSGLSDGYLVVGSSIATQTTFFHAPGFDPSILALAEATKGTVTFGEFFTTSRIVKPAMGFRGPLAIVAGNEDMGFCYGNCSYPTNLLAEVAPALYPDVLTNNTATYLAPMAGHGLNLHYTAAAAFDFIQGFLKKHDL